MNALKIKDFLRDRAAYALAYFLSTAAAIIIMNLTLIINRIDLSVGNILYAFLISIILFILFLVWDYFRNKQFHWQLNLLLNSEELDNILNIGYTSTKEQEMFKEILLKTYSICGDRTVKYEEAHKQYIYFVNQWVHQMKTPVSVIDLLLQDQMRDGNKEVFESISEENEKLSHGLEMMLYNARLNEFNIDFNVESLEIIQEVRKIINNNKKSFIRNHIFPKIIGDEQIIVETDRKWISFAINQIVSNAIKYSKSECCQSKSIDFILKKEETKITLSICDQGIGIPKEDLGRVFNAFFTGKNGRKNSESTGMGMYLAKRICDKLGHELLVESEVTKGSTFSIVFYKGKNLFKF